MPDIAVEYTLDTPGGTITFNDGADDQFYITEITMTTPLRTPVDPAPLDDGGLVHDFWLEARPVAVEGVFLITSVPLGSGLCQQIRNEMEADLEAALQSILRADGTLTWTPVGQVEHALTVRYHRAAEYPHIENYLLRAFNFGLIAADPVFALGS